MLHRDSGKWNNWLLIKQPIYHINKNTLESALPQSTTLVVATDPEVKLQVAWAICARVIEVSFITFAEMENVHHKKG